MHELAGSDQTTESAMDEARLRCQIVVVLQVCAAAAKDTYAGKNGSNSLKPF